MKKLFAILTFILGVGVIANAQSVNTPDSAATDATSATKMTTLPKGDAKGSKQQMLMRGTKPEQQTLTSAKQGNATVVINQEPTLSRHDSIRLYRKPNAMRAVWMGAIIPGYGQIYNCSYWKLPIVYGAFFGCAYAITWTNGLYTDYKTAYRDIYTDITNNAVTEEDTKSYIAILPEGYTLSNVGGASKWQSTLQTRQNSYRRYRDISIVATIAVYALSLIDAYVDAQLFDFDISPDLSMSVEPEINHDFMNHPTGEMKLAFAF